MSETAIVGENVEVVQTGAPASSALSWSAAIAGALAAVAVTFIFVSLGSGIGLSLASPYRVRPSLATLSAAGAVWLVMSQAFGFAVGGYLSARLRSRSHDTLSDETVFRDGAQGFMAWVLAVVANLAVAAAAAGLLGASAAIGTGAALGGQQVAGAVGPGGARMRPNLAGYYTDALLRPAPGTTTRPGSSGAAAAGGRVDRSATPEQRQEISRILAVSLAQGRLTNEDHDYLVELVAQRDGLSREEASRRVDGVIRQMAEATQQAADKAARFAAYASFWAFLSLLIGAAAGTLAGIVGGELRDRRGPGPLARSGWR